MNNEIITQLEITMQRRIAALPERIRLFTQEQSLPQSLLLTGPRGVGKTTCLLYHAAQNSDKTLYFSADNPLLISESLFQLCSSIFMTGYKGVIIDEVHFAKDWSLHLKALFDDFPDRKIWVSDSSSLVLRNSRGDLSRRFVSVAMPFLSFREFLHLETGAKYPKHDAFNLDKEIPLAPTSEILDLFRTYREYGTRPFYKDGNFQDRMLAVLDKTLYYDIPFFLPQITDGNLRLMKAIVGTLSQNTIPRIQVRSLCSDWGIGAEKLYQLLEVMESVGIIRIIRKENDTKARSTGAKLFFSDPAMYAILSGKQGTAREALVATLCALSGWQVWASKKEEHGDFILTSANQLYTKKRILIEVGGKNKSVKKADYVIRDDIDYPAGNAIPAWLLGMGF